DNGMITYRAQLKSEKVEDKAYLEMWCRIPGKGEFFSKGLVNPLQGTTGWASYEIPFFLEKGQEPDLLKLNLVFEGKGTIWIKDIEVLFTSKEPANAVGLGMGVTPEWIASLQKLQPEKQVEAVAAKLKELNPGFDGKIEHKITNGPVIELGLVTDTVTDLSPLQGLSRLRVLRIKGSSPGKGRLVDLTPLRDLPLVYLDVPHNPITDLKPLAGMPLTTLICRYTKVADLSPLRGMKLQSFTCARSAVSDLSPLTGIDLV